VRALRNILVGANMMLVVVAAYAQQVPNHIAGEISDAQLIGDGQFRWFGFKVYDAQLWGRPGYKPMLPSADKFALDFRYARAFSGKKIAESGIHEIEKLGFGTPQQRQRWLQDMENCFPDVGDGTHLTGIYEPGAGAVFYRDGKKICEVQDADFGVAFFAIWLDPRTTANRLREELLARVSSGP
jgi:hypothetical protein